MVSRSTTEHGFSLFVQRRMSKLGRTLFGHGIEHCAINTQRTNLRLKGTGWTIEMSRDRLVKFRSGRVRFKFKPGEAKSEARGRDPHPDHAAFDEKMSREDPRSVPS